MKVQFPNESAEYRAARGRLLEKEIELRRQMEAVAEERRKLPPGGMLKEDYVFDGLGPDGKPARIRFSELFAPGRDTLIVYNMMFRAIRPTRGRSPIAVPSRACRARTARVRPARRWSTSSTARRRILKRPASTS